MGNSETPGETEVYLIIYKNLFATYVIELVTYVITSGY